MTLQDANTLGRLDRAFEIDKWTKEVKQIDLAIDNVTIPVYIQRNGLFGYVASVGSGLHMSMGSKVPSVAFQKLADRIQARLGSGNAGTV